MSRPFRNYCLPVLLLVGFLFFSRCEKDPSIDPSSTCEEIKTQNNHPRGERFQSILDQYVKKGLPGITCLINSPQGQWVGASGMSDLQEKTPMQNCQVSKVASITKMFMGTLTMLLVEDSIFSLDEKAADYLPEKVVEEVANADQTTIRQLMNHRSGIHDVVSDPEFYLAILNQPNQVWTPEKLLEYVYGRDAYFKVGTDDKYSNTNYLLLSMVIEEATGKEHEDLMRERIIHPLGLDQTFYDPHDGLPDHVAQGYYDLYNDGTIMNVSNYITGNGNGYTGLFSNVFDLKTMGEALFKYKTLVSDSSLATMKTFKGGVDGGRSLGIGIYKDHQDKREQDYAFGHRGRDLGYTADLFYFPEHQVTMVFLINYGTNAESSLKPVFNDFRDKLVNTTLP